MDTLVVQTGVRHGRVAELTRSSEGRLSIGRAYDNDLVLTDVHIAARQVEFFYDDSVWQMSVLDSTNPVLLNDKPVVGEQATIKSGDTLTIGRMKLYLFSADHQVERTKKLVMSNWLAGETRNRSLPFALLAAACLLDTLISYFEGSIDLKWSEIASGELILLVLILAWSSLWSLAGRILRHQPHFGLQVMATSLVALLAIVLTTGSAYVAYPFHSAKASEFLGWGILFVELALLFRLNLLIATNIRDTTMAACAFSALLLGVAYGFIQLTASDDYSFEPEYSALVKPPFVHIREGVSVDDYFSQLAVEVEAADEGR